LYDYAHKKKEDSFAVFGSYCSELRIKLIDREITFESDDL